MQKEIFYLLFDNVNDEDFYNFYKLIMSDDQLAKFIYLHERHFTFDEIIKIKTKLSQLLGFINDNMHKRKVFQ